MKKICFCIILFLIAGSVLSAQELPKITIVNNTGYPIYQLWIQPAGDDWNNWAIQYTVDINRSNLLSTGHSIEITLPLPLNIINTYDIYLYDTDEDMYIKENVRISAGLRVVFVFDDIDW